MGVKYDLRRESYMAVEIRREWYTLYTTFVCKCKTRAAYNTCRRTPIPYFLFRCGWPTFAIDIKDLQKPLPNFQYGGWGSIPHLGFDIPYLNFNKLLIFSKSWTFQ